MPTPTGFTSIIASHIRKDASSALLNSGILQIIPTDGNDVPINATAGGDGGALSTAAAEFVIDEGAIPDESYIADTNMTNPPHICYRMTVKDAWGKQIFVARKVQPTGSEFNFDTFVPNVAPQAIIQSGPAGATPNIHIVSVTKASYGSDPQFNRVGGSDADPQFAVSLPEGAPGAATLNDGDPINAGDTTVTKFQGSPRYVSPNGLDGTAATDESTAINAAIAASRPGIVLPPGRFKADSYSNVYGAPIYGDGMLVKTIDQTSDNDGAGTSPVTATLAKTGVPETHQYMQVTGREHLHRWMEVIRNGSNAKVIFSGDSTTAGVAISDSNYLIHNMFKAHCVAKGVNHVTSLNTAISGTDTYNWYNEPTMLAADITAAPDLYVIRFGINDQDQGQKLATYYRLGLQQFRETYSVDQASVVIVSPSTTNDGPHGRDAFFYDSIIPLLKQIADEYQCCFIDIYNPLRDSNHAGNSMDKPYTHYPANDPPISVHPKESRNLMIMSLIADVLLPSQLCASAAANTVRNISGGDDTPAESKAPEDYAVGITSNRATGSGWPFDGQVVTFRHVDGVDVLQICSAYTNATASISRFAFRTAASDTTWNDWVTLQDPSLPYTSSGPIRGLVKDTETSQAVRIAAGSLQMSLSLNRDPATGDPDNVYNTRVHYAQASSVSGASSHEFWTESAPAAGLAKTHTLGHFGVKSHKVVASGDDCTGYEESWNFGADGHIYYADPATHEWVQKI